MSLDFYNCKLTYGLIPFGAATGQRAILIDIGNNPDTSHVEGDAYRLFREKVVDFKLEKEYFKALDGSLMTFLIFKGGAVELNDNATEFQDFFHELSKEAALLQMPLTNDKKRPPFCIWYGLPIEFSSQREGTGEVYQYFNSCWAIIKQPVQKEINYLGLQQLINHQFSMVCFEYVEKETEKTLEDLKKRYNFFKKAAFIDAGEKPSSVCKFRCIENDIRYYRYEKGDYTLCL
jgi:hypothetical protein